MPVRATAITLLMSIAMLALSGRSATADPPGSIEVEITGVLRSLAGEAGEEKTGVTISAKGITWRLDFGQDDKAREDAAKLDGKTLWVRGGLEPREGGDVNRRWLVTVEEWRLAGDENDGKPEVSAKSRRTDSRVELSGAGEEVFATVTSQSGLGSATLSRVGERWPKALVVRLHLRGLESLVVDDGATVVEWSKSSSGAQDCRVSIRQKAGEERAIKLGHQYFSELKTVGGDGKVPLRDGYFEIALPAALLDGNPQEIALRWIDFYR